MKEKGKECLLQAIRFRKFSGGTFIKTNILPGGANLQNIDF